MTSLTTLRLVVTATAVALSGLAAPTAIADIQRVRVDISDLNLQTDKGAATFVQRIEAASEEACRRSSDNNRLVRSVSQRQAIHKDYEHCMAEAIADAVDDIEEPIAMSVVEARIDTLMSQSKTAG
ncbi:MAG: UrcA family protein [Pseudomonadota bacterium]